MRAVGIVREGVIRVLLSSGGTTLIGGQVTLCKAARVRAARLLVDTGSYLPGARADAGGHLRCIRGVRLAAGIVIVDGHAAELPGKITVDAPRRLYKG